MSASIQTISIPAASGGYDVLLGEGLLDTCAPQIAALGAQTVLIVSDDAVFPLYGERLSRCLSQIGLRVCRFVFPHGEASKNQQTYLELIGRLIECGLTRRDLLIALGGGVVGDLCGFAAATYLRGVGCVQIPTTLLAAVDSSVGGKTAIDFYGRKNAVGCFWPPKLVVCDPSLLRTLPEKELSGALAEVVKYAMLFGEDFFSFLENGGADRQPEVVIEQCIRMKRALVAQDEFDTGCRRLLNFGHTFGHAIEQASGYSVPHGMAVAAGMRLVTRSCVCLGDCGSRTEERLNALLDRFGCITPIPYSVSELCALASSDKKKEGGSIWLVLPRQIGQCELRSFPVCELASFLKAGGMLA